jgi:hypothetical protein
MSAGLPVANLVQHVSLLVSFSFACNSLPVLKKGITLRETSTVAHVRGLRPVPDREGSEAAYLDPGTPSKRITDRREDSFDKPLDGANCGPCGRRRRRGRSHLASDHGGRWGVNAREAAGRDGELIAPEGIASRVVHQLGDRAAARAADMVAQEGGVGTVIGAMWSKILARVEALQWKGCLAPET